MSPTGTAVARRWILVKQKLHMFGPPRFLSAYQKFAHIHENARRLLKFVGSFQNAGGEAE